MHLIPGMLIVACLLIALKIHRDRRNLAAKDLIEAQLAANRKRWCMDNLRPVKSQWPR